MLNKFPLWKNLLILLVIGLGFVYAMPNLYPEEFAVQISGARSTTAVDDRTLTKVTETLDAAGIAYRSPVLGERNASVRFDSGEDQLRAKTVLQRALGDGYLVALNLAPTTPEWLSSLGAGPMKLGLDLRGGVHFLLEVDMEKALEQRLDVYSSEIKRRLREEKIRYRGGDRASTRALMVEFRDEADRDKAFDLARREFGEFLLEKRTQGERLELWLNITEQKVREIEDYAVQQNLTTMRNRVNELGVAEPLVQRQGRNRIVVELPGVQDTAAAKRVLGATANLEFRLEARADASVASTETFNFRDEEGRSAVVERDIIVTGNSVASASQGFDENGQPQVNISLDSAGGKMMNRITRNAIKRRMAVLFIEHKTRESEVMVDGAPTVQRERVVEKSIISLATIQSALGSEFRITGVGSITEAAELALLLRAGSLAAPIYFVEERTIGPSLGQQNIDAGLTSVQIGFAAVVLFMVLYYKVFGLIANIALAANMVLLVACMSMLSATLTLPGIAGIVLTVGMAVDANVLIFERIREELREGSPIQSAIHAGYSRAFVSILDANLTTLIAAVILFAVGTGPVKGFAITLSIGILTSMFTALVVSRGIVNLVYGGRRFQKLYI